MQQKMDTQGPGPFGKAGKVLGRFIQLTLGLGRDLARKPLDANCASVGALDRLALRLDIEERARVDGSNEQPTAAEEKLSGTQLKIAEYFWKLERTAERHIGQTIDKLMSMGRDIDVAEAISKLRDVPSRCEKEISRILTDTRSRLQFLHEQEMQQRERASELETAEVDEEDEGPQSAALYYVLTVTLVGMAALALGNKWVWGVDRLALLPAGTAVWMALAAAIVPFLTAAVSCRPAVYIDEREKLARRLTQVAGFVFLGGVAVFVAHFVIVVAAEPAAQIGSALAAMMAEPLAMTASADAWKGFGVVGLTGVLAFLLGHQAAQASPASSSSEQSASQQSKSREHLLKAMRRRIDKVVDTAEGDIDKMSFDIKAKIRGFGAMAEEIRRIESQIADFRVALEDGCSLTLERYREANSRARSTAAPASFSEHICFRPDKAAEVASFADARKRAAQIEKDKDRFSAALAEVRQQLRDLNREAAAELANNTVEVRAWLDGEVEQPAY